MLFFFRITDEDGIVGSRAVPGFPCGSKRIDNPLTVAKFQADGNAVSGSPVKIYFGYQVFPAKFPGQIRVNKDRADFFNKRQRL